MAYTLAALLLPASRLEALPDGVSSTLLTTDVALVPLPDLEGAAHDELELVHGYYYLTEDALADLRNWAPAIGPVAYIEAEFFGGTGRQSSVVIDASGNTVMEAHTAAASEAELGDVIDPPVEEWAINRALAALGVSPGNALDRFAAVDLGAHRSTIAWLGQDRSLRGSTEPR